MTGYDALESGQWSRASSAAAGLGRTLIYGYQCSVRVPEGIETLNRARHGAAATRQCRRRMEVSRELEIQS